MLTRRPADGTNRCCRALNRAPNQDDKSLRFSHAADDRSHKARNRELERQIEIMDRRQFIAASLSASAAAALNRERFTPTFFAAPPKHILILGGTSFLGPALVEAALVGGHSVTLFNRGITNPELFPYVDKVRGLRSVNVSEENLSGLRSRRWDAVVDVWPFEPQLVESAAKELAPRASHYLYVSSIAAYDARGFAQPGLTESGMLNPWDASIRPYNRGKAESERRLSKLVGERLTIVRPGPIKGTRDDTPDLLTWLRRAQRGGRHIGPGTGDDHVQIVDVKDVARFLVLAIERQAYGTFNLVGTPITFRDYLGRCNAVMRSTAEFVWIPRAFLHEQGLDPAPFNSPTIPHYLGNFPSWHPEPERRGLAQISNSRAISAGWRLRPFDETAIDYLAWIDLLGPTFEWTDQLLPEMERRVLGAFAAAHGAHASYR